MGQTLNTEGLHIKAGLVVSQVPPKRTKGHQGYLLYPAINTMDGWIDVDILLTCYKINVCLLKLA